MVSGQRVVSAGYRGSPRLRRLSERAQQSTGLSFGTHQESPNGRKCHYASGVEKRNTPMRKIALRNREPWLLTCTRQLDHLSAQSIVKLHAQRMRIGQQFRDTKNAAFGIGLSQSRSAGARTTAAASQRE